MSQATYAVAVSLYQDSRTSFSGHLYLVGNETKRSELVDHTLFDSYANRYSEYELCMPKMVSAHHFDEYNTIVSLTRPFSTPIGQTYISTYDAPLNVLQLCCSRTLGRGRILYEVHDEGSSGVIGYVVPTDVSQFAHKYKHGVSLAGWNGCGYVQDQVLRRAFALLQRRFPQIPEVDAKEISELALQRRWRYDEDMLEEVVVDYILHEWTSYDFRIYGSGEDPARSGRELSMRFGEKHQQVFEIVKPRLREMIRSWLPGQVIGRDLNAFYARHRLSDDSSQGKEDSTTEVRYDTTRSYYGGAETIANITTRPSAFS